MTLENGPKQNISLIIGLAIPVAMVLFIAVAINGPRWFSTIDPPRYDFLYAIGQQNPYANYLVKDGRLVVQESAVPDGTASTAQNSLHFFVHDVTANASREIPVEEAVKLALDGSVRSPDGFSIENGRRGGWFIFGYGRRSASRYVVKDSYSEKLDLETQNSGYNYYWNYHFLGWVSGNE